MDLGIITDELDVLLSSFFPLAFPIPQTVHENVQSFAVNTDIEAFFPMRNPFASHLQFMGSSAGASWAP